MLSAFIAPAGIAQSHEDKPPRTDTRHRMKNAVKKCSKTIKKQVKNLHK